MEMVHWRMSFFSGAFVPCLVFAGAVGPGGVRRNRLHVLQPARGSQVRKQLDLVLGFPELRLEIGGPIAKLLVRPEQLFMLSGADRPFLGSGSGDPRQTAARRQRPTEHSCVGVLQPAGSISRDEKEEDQPHEHAPCEEHSL